jgi:indole-3-glycerol phosphate synthase
MIRDVVPLPILRKDFMIDPYQLYEARAAGADAILLIAEILSDSQITDFQILATELRLTALIEVHEMDSLLRVRNLVGFPMRSYSLLGINNRDLRTFTVDINNTIRLADLVPDRNVLVAESGIKTRDDVKKLHAAGVRILLVGETLMRTGDVKSAMKEIKGM